MLSCKIGKRIVLEIQVLGVLQMPKGSLIGYSIVNHSPRIVDWFSIKFRLHTDKEILTTGLQVLTCHPTVQRQTSSIQMMLSTKYVR